MLGLILTSWWMLGKKARNSGEHMLAGSEEEKVRKVWVFRKNLVSGNVLSASLFRGKHGRFTFKSELKKIEVKRKFKSFRQSMLAGDGELVWKHDILNHAQLQAQPFPKMAGLLPPVLVLQWWSQYRLWGRLVIISNELRKQPHIYQPLACKLSMSTDGWSPWEWNLKCVTHMPRIDQLRYTEGRHMDAADLGERGAAEERNMISEGYSPRTSWSHSSWIVRIRDAE